MFVVMNQTSTFTRHVSAYIMTKLENRVPKFSLTFQVVPTSGVSHMNFPSKEQIFRIIPTPHESLNIWAVSEKTSADKKMG